MTAEELGIPEQTTDISILALSQTRR